MGHVPTQKCQKIRLETILKNLGQIGQNFQKSQKMAQNARVGQKLCGIDGNTSDFGYIPKKKSEIPNNNYNMSLFSL